MFPDLRLGSGLAILMVFFLTPLSSGIAVAGDNHSLDSLNIRIAKTLYGQLKLAQTELEIAAATGDPESQFFLAEYLREMSQYMTSDAQFWYEQSAAQGDLYAMFRLSRRESDTCEILNNCPPNSASSTVWTDKLQRTALARAEGGDGEAMCMMFKITRKIEWLRKAAEAGHHESQWLLAGIYKDGSGYFWPGQRSKAIEHLLQQSAEGGFPEGIISYAGYFAEKGDHKLATAWMLKGVAIGYAHAISGYAHVLQYETPYKVPKDLKMSYAMHSLLLDLDGGGRLNEMSALSMRELEVALSPAEIQEALQYAEDWKKAHPPVSYYPIKLGL